MKNEKLLNQKTEEIFKQIGSFGPYQLLIFILVGLISFIPAIVGYSYSFYGATPSFRCKIPELYNDTYEIQNDFHSSLIDKYIPISKDKNFKNKYDKCNLKIFIINNSNSNNYTLQKCSQWVYSNEYFDKTLITDWNLVCENSSRKSLFATLYFIGTYGVFLSGILSDRFGRKKAIYIFVLANSILNAFLSILINFELFNLDIQQILFGVIRLICGIASNVYAATVVMAIEICGPSKRVTAANSIYYMYIAGEFVVVLFAYFIRDYKKLYLSYTILMCSFLFYFWLVPESPRWLMTKKKNYQAYLIFKKIAVSNKKNLDELTELESLKKTKLSHHDENGNAIHPLKDLNEKDDTVEVLKPISPKETIKIFFKSKKLILRSLVTLLNWLTNTLVYYGISFNTNELVGNPYLNFTLSVLVELVAILATHYTLDKFGRRIPYSINMAMAGISLLFVLFIPNDLGILITLIALISKFAISFTYNTIYIITAEMYPTVIRNSSVSICQTFARMGAIIAPNIQLLGELYWYPLPFIVYGSFSTLSAITFIFFMPETKNKILPDTIEEFIQ